MAKRMNRETEAKPPGDNNSKEIRAGAIRQVIKDLRALEAKRDTITEAIRELKQTIIKGDLNMKMADFSFARRLYELDDDPRSEFFATLRETFDALGHGDQLGFMDALEPKTKQTGEGEDPTPERATELGVEAGRGGEKLSACPFKLPRQKKLRAAWETGWESGQTKIADEMKQPEAVH